MPNKVWTAELTDSEWARCEEKHLDQMVDELELAWERIKADFMPEAEEAERE